MTDLLELADRCERAEGPDRDLDERLKDLLRSPRLSDDEIEARLARGESVFSGCLVWNHREGPSASIDAALRMVPGGCVWRVTSRIEQHLPTAKVQQERHGGPDLAVWAGEAATPALALCAAALRARAAMEAQDEDA